jgi:hypothetical protein
MGIQRPSAGLGGTKPPHREETLTLATNSPLALLTPVVAAGSRPLAGAPPAMATRAAGDAHHGGTFPSLFLYRARGGAWTEQPAAGAPPATADALHRGARRGPPSLPFLFHCRSISVLWRGDAEKDRRPSCPFVPACSTAKDGGGVVRPLPPKGIFPFGRGGASPSTAHGSSSPSLHWMRMGIERNRRGRRRRRSLPASPRLKPGEIFSSFVTFGLGILLGFLTVGKLGFAL